MKIFVHNLYSEKEINFTRNFNNLLVGLIKRENKKLGEINVIFTGNAEILRINKLFLNHDYFTDVITFGRNKRNTLSGDIYISIEQVRINAKNYDLGWMNELARVIIHGFLHLVGYNDGSNLEKIAMKEKEEEYLCGFEKEEFVIDSEI